MTEKEMIEAWIKKNGVVRVLDPRYHGDKEVIITCNKAITLFAIFDGGMRTPSRRARNNH